MATCNPSIEDVNEAQAAYDLWIADTPLYQSTVNKIAAFLDVEGTGGEEMVALSIFQIYKSWFGKQYARFSDKVPEPMDIAVWLRNNREVIRSFRGRSILTLVEQDREVVTALFKSFIESGPHLGSSTAGIAFHLLVPEFFPSWNEKITSKYKVSAGDYWAFMLKVKAQVACLVDNGMPAQSAVRSVDKYNFYQLGAYVTKRRKKLQS